MKPTQLQTKHYLRNINVRLKVKNLRNVCLIISNIIKVQRKFHGSRTKKEAVNEMFVQPTFPNMDVLRQYIRKGFYVQFTMCTHYLSM